jgi:predicted nucleotidyltransferase
MNMIQSWLEEMEYEHQIDILFAVETGSRAWGGATSHSDYDIRFIFKPSQVRTYLSMKKALETLDFPAPYDAVGWDLFKTFHLLEKSNGSLLEWAVSPIVYRDHHDFSKKLRLYIEECYSLFSLYQHYIHLMARNIKEVHHKSYNEKRQKQLIQAVRSFLLAKEIVLYRNIPFRVLYSSFSKSTNEDTICSFYLLLMDSKQKGCLVSENLVDEMISTMVGEREWLEKLANDLPRGKQNVQKLNEWIWELLKI